MVMIELEHVSGPEQDAETMLDALAATIGRDNSARSPLTLTTTDNDGERTAVYVVALVDDAQS
jgi:hypothetical protein